ncbi:uncharacterized protein LOC141588817 [Silene latifolia]|uniref:uncharacterized protein LOC141588817 n=1 Tax=Silene latifolia TaxID=37657 RepID=UPI003D774D42
MNQSAFIQDIEIVDNILIFHDLVRLYNRKSCSPRVLMKIDLRKVYDTIEWGFLHEMLVALMFPDQMVDWIMQCVTTTSFSLSLNGTQFGHFKVCMEYLTRILNLVTERPEFRFHSLCKTLKLSHLAFADDLLLFCGGDSQSVRVMMRAFLSFSAVSGLHMNRDKSDLYMNGVTGTEVHNILNILGFHVGTFPFRYIRIPISYKRISVAECNRVVDKIVCRIRGWGAKHLSYAGRLILVQSVLTQMHSYWARVFLLPKTVIHKVESVYRSYLWADSAESYKVPYVAWEQCCLPKNKGGLGIVNCPLWNVTSIGKYTWWVVNKKDCLWVKWVHQIYIKHSDWWTYQPNTNTSWVWRQVCKVKEQPMPGFETHSWSACGYSVQKVYEWILGSQQRVIWQPFVWNRLSLPKHNFLAWLFVKKRCLTQDRLLKFGVITDGICYLCGAQQETQAHLFFYCCYSQRCAHLLQQWLGVEWVIKWRCKSLCKKMIVMAAISGLLHCIWEVRNKCKADMVMKRPEAVIAHIQAAIRWRLQRSDFAKQLDNSRARETSSEYKTDITELSRQQTSIDQNLLLKSLELELLKKENAKKVEQIDGLQRDVSNLNQQVISSVTATLEHMVLGSPLYNQRFQGSGKRIDKVIREIEKEDKAENPTDIELVKMFEIAFSRHEKSPIDTETVISMFFSLICLCFSIGHLLEEKHWANESNTSLILEFFCFSV